MQSPNVITAAAWLLAIAASCMGADPASAPATAPAGKWRCYLKSDAPAMVAGGRDNIYFRCGAGVWRYDVKTQATRQLSPIDGANLVAGGRCTLGPGESLAIAGRSQPCVWSPSGRADVFKSPPGGDPHTLQYDRLSRLWALTATQAYRWEGGWKLVGDVPSHEEIALLGDHWLMFRGGLGPRPYGTYFLIDGEMDKITPFKPKASETLLTFCRAGDELFGMFARTPQSGSPGEFVLSRISDTAVADVIEGQSVGASFDGKTFLKLTVLKSEGSERLCQVETSGREKPAPLTLVASGWEFRPTLFKDANGHIWVNNSRWDGRAWKTFGPPDAFPFPSLGLALAGRLELSPQMRWQASADDSAELENPTYDPKTRQAWVCVQKDPAWTLQLVQFEGASSRTLQSFDLPEPVVGQPLRAGDGRWWWVTQSNAYCLQADGSLSTFPTRIGDDIPGHAHPALAISPRGGVWLWHAERYWGRYDPKEDRFVKDYPYEDFSFSAGALALSAEPATGGEKAFKLWRKNKDQWEPMPNPFGTGSLYVSTRCMIGQRLLVTCWQGAFEYDASADTWICLNDRRDLIAGFDPAGRRVLATDDAAGLLFVFDGDPFVSAGDGGRAAAEHFDALLKLLDDADYQVRTKATQALQEMGDKSADLIHAALRNPDLPAEVRDRLESVLKNLPPAEALPQKNLFSRMHPPLVPQSSP